MQTSDVIDQGQDMAERKKEAGAGQLDGIARAVHRAADELENQMPGASDFIHGAASQLEKGAEALRSRSIDSLIGSFNAFGRREPLALFGGAIIGGFAVARFLKSSSTGSSGSASGRESRRAQ
jgi:hypothetical protein